MKVFPHPFRSDWIQLSFWDILKLLLRLKIGESEATIITWGKRKKDPRMVE